MGGGSGGGNTTTTTKADPWIGVQPYLSGAYQQLSDLYQPGQGPQYYPGQTVANPNALEGQGQQQLLNAVPGMAGTAQQAQNNLSSMGETGQLGTWRGLGYTDTALTNMQGIAGNAQAGVGGALNAMDELYAARDPSSNPYFQSALQSAIRPVTQQFNEQVMPAIQQGAQAAGQMGGSRQGIAEGIAARGYQDTVGDISANMGNQAYAQGLQALQASGQLGSGLGSLAGQLQTAQAGIGQNMYGQGLTGLGQSAALAGGVQAAQAVPGQVTQGIGQQLTANQQQQIDADMARYGYGQNLPYSMIQDYLTALNGGAMLGGSQTAQQAGGGSSRATGALGGAATGAAIGSAFAPGMGTAIGAGAGALYGLFM